VTIRYGAFDGASSYLFTKPKYTLVLPESLETVEDLGLFVAYRNVTVKGKSSLDDFEFTTEDSFASMRFTFEP